MIATDFTRESCQVGQRRRSYRTLAREYRCNACGGRLVQHYKDGWRIHCGRCGSVDFIHECELQRQKAEATEVLDGLLV